MNRHLFALSIGPVQDFIAAARRTRDLWFGSHMLSEISKAAAKSIVDSNSNHLLIFPCPQDRQDLEAESSLIVANVVIAQIQDDDPAEVARVAKQAACDRWLKYAEEVRQKLSGVIRQTEWNIQVSDVVETAAAWVPLGDDYSDSRRRLMRLLAGRKACRDFRPSAIAGEGIPKSSLDGSRESILLDHDEVPIGSGRKKKLRLGPGEQLDAVGAVKRLGGGERPYPSISRVALEPWIEGVTSSGRGDELLRKVADICQQKELSISRIDPARYPQYSRFPFEGTPLITGRLRQLSEELELEPEMDSTLKEIGRLNSELSRLGYKEPDQHIAILQADGDKMGAAISSLKHPDHHREFSRALSLFAGEAEEIVVDHQGTLVYAGGDDVLAMLPVHRVLECARALHSAFDKVNNRLTESDVPWPPTEGAVTLSVGVAIGHTMESLEDLRRWATEAEKHAKKSRCHEVEGGDRNGLAVHLRTRGGAPVCVRDTWSRPLPDALDTRLNGWCDLLIRNVLPDKVAYDIRVALRHYHGWERSGIALKADLIRLVRQKANVKSQEALTKLESMFGQIENLLQAQQLVNEILISRRLAISLVQTGERRRKEVMV